MEAQRVVGTLADTLPEAEAEILLERPSDVEYKILVDKLERPLAEAKSERLGDTLGNVELEKLVQTVANTLPLVNA